MPVRLISSSAAAPALDMKDLEQMLEALRGGELSTGDGVEACLREGVDADLHGRGT